MDDFPSCSVSLSFSKALWYLLKSTPGDSKMCFKGQGTSSALSTFGMLRLPIHKARDSGRDRGSLLEDSSQQPLLVLFRNPTKTQSKRRRRLPWHALVPHGWRSSFQPWTHWRPKLGDVSHSNLWQIGSIKFFHHPSDPWLSHKSPFKSNL